MEKSNSIQNPDEQLLTLFVKVAVKPGSEDKVRAALLADVHGARDEPGNYKMELYQAKGQPQDFYLMERWQNQAALDDHFAQPYVRTVFELEKSVFSGPAQLSYLEDLFPDSLQVKKEVHQSLVTLLVPFEVKPGKGPEFAAIFERFVPIVRKEPGSVNFHLYRVKDDENRFVLYERWDNQFHSDGHANYPTTARAVEEISPLLTAPLMSMILFAEDIS